MADQVPIRADLDGSSLTGLAIFSSDETVGVAHGGTGLATVATDNILTGNGTLALTSESNLTFDGSVLAVSGKNFVDYDSGNDAIRFGSAIGARKTAAMIFRANDTERMRIDSAGNVGIGGSTAPANWTLTPRLNIEGVSPGIHLKDTTGSAKSFVINANADTLYFANDTDNDASLQMHESGTVSVGGASSTQSFFIDRTGTGSGTSDIGHRFTPAQYYLATNSGVGMYISSTSTGNIMGFRYNDTPVGGVSIGTSSTTFDTTSDYRLKENVVIMANATERVSNLLPIRFNWKVDPSVEVDGFLAHEAALVVPEAVIGIKDERRTINDVVMDANGVKIDKNIPEDQWIAGKADGRFSQDSTWVAEKEVDWYQTIDNSKFVPLLTAAIQELTARITALESA